MNVLVVSEKKKMEFIDEIKESNNEIKIKAVNFKQIESIAKENYDLVIMDFDEKKIKSKDYADVFQIKCKISAPILGIVENATSRNKLDLLYYGINDYIDRPFTFSSINEKIVNLLREFRIKKLITEERLEE